MALLPKNQLYINKQKVALVDFDGVIIKNKVVNEQVKNRVVGYVQKVSQCINLESSDKLNAYLYKKHGHTLIGLQQVYGKTAGSLNDFNDYVYGNSYIERDVYYQLKTEIQQWNKFCLKMQSAGIPVYIFSNAPKEWCLQFIEDNNINGFVWDIVDKNDCEYLKPQRTVYKELNDWFGDDTSIYFVDDRPANFQIDTVNWNKILMNDEIEQPWGCLNSTYFVARDLKSCEHIITSF